MKVYLLKSFAFLLKGKHAVVDVLPRKGMHERKNYVVISSKVWVKSKLEAHCQALMSLFIKYLAFEMFPRLRLHRNRPILYILIRRLIKS